MLPVYESVPIAPGHRPVLHLPGIAANWPPLSVSVSPRVPPFPGLFQPVRSLCVALRSEYANCFHVHVNRTSLYRGCSRKLRSRANARPIPRGVCLCASLSACVPLFLPCRCPYFVPQLLRAWPNTKPAPAILLLNLPLILVRCFLIVYGNLRNASQLRPAPPLVFVGSRLTHVFQLHADSIESSATPIVSKSIRTRDQPVVRSPDLHPA